MSIHEEKAKLYYDSRKSVVRELDPCEKIWCDKGNDLPRYLKVFDGKKERI